MEQVRVLVTGGCGFLGTAIVSALLNTKRYAITAIDINPPSLGSTTFANDVRYVRCDVLDSASLFKVFSEARPAIVVHTVGVFPLGTKRYSMKGKEAVFKVNVEGTRNVIEASRECGSKGLVYTSSVTVVLDELDKDFKNVDERWPLGRASTSYGLSKVFEVFSLNTFCKVSFSSILYASSMCSIISHTSIVLPSNHSTISILLWQQTFYSSSRHLSSHSISLSTTCPSLNDNPSNCLLVYLIQKF
jgi:sterol-4alpha-carboxylate 3-dehydrogenase (decarboxylating)